MLNYIWLGLILCAVVIGGETHHMKDVGTMGLSLAVKSVIEVGLPMVGTMALWLGMMRLAEKAGLVQALSRLLRPVMRWLFPDVPAEHPAMGSMMLNMAANMLALSNAATPFGLRAMDDLETLNPRPGTATNAMCTFLTINTCSIQFVPITALGILVAQKSVNPTVIVGPAFVASFSAAIVAVLCAKFLEKLPMFRLPPVTREDEEKKAREKKEIPPPPEPVALKPMNAWRVLLLVVFFVFFFVLYLDLAFPKIFGRALAPDEVNETAFARLTSAFSILAMPLLISFFPLYATLRGMKVYEEFVTGAKEGFQVVLRIIPNLVAMLVAIGMVRGSGGIDLLTSALAPLMAKLHFPPELMPLALMRPLSGSGTNGMLAEIVLNHGPDSFISRMASVMQGSSETTFYVLAIYFGAVKISRARHAVIAGLMADAASLVASVIVANMVFS